MVTPWHVRLRPLWNLFWCTTICGSNSHRIRHIGVQWMLRMRTFIRVEHLCFLVVECLEVLTEHTEPVWLEGFLTRVCVWVQCDNEPSLGHSRCTICAPGPHTSASGDKHHIVAATWSQQSISILEGRHEHHLCHATRCFPGLVIMLTQHSSLCVDVERHSSTVYRLLGHCLSGQICFQEYPLDYECVQKEMNDFSPNAQLFPIDSVVLFLNFISSYNKHALYAASRQQTS